MDDAFVFGRALSLAEVQSLYTNAPNTAPVVPTGVAATPVSSGTVSVSWVADTNAVSHDVSVTNTSTSVVQVFNTTAATSYSVTGLTNGTVYDFKVLATNSLGSSAYSSTVSATPTLGTAKNILTFLVPGQPDGVISGTNISVTVPTGTNVSAFSPTYTVSNLASGSPASGTTRDFTSPQTYTITAEDGSTQVYTVTVTQGAVASIFTWTTGSGNWSDSSKWVNDLSNGLRPGTFGQSYYTLNFNQAVTATNDLSASYVVNRLNFGNTVTLGGNSLALTTNGATLPTINQNSGSAVTISAPLNLASDTTLGGNSTGSVTISGAITGAGSLTKINGGTLTLGNNINTYNGNTTISAGTVAFVDPGSLPGSNNNSALGASATKIVTIGSGATLSVQRATLTGSQLVMSGGTYQDNNGYGSSWNGAVVLNANSVFDGTGNAGSITINGVISGAGGLTRTAAGNTLVLNSTNTYFGPTIINGKTLQLDASGSIDNTSLISIAAGATFDVSAKTSNFALTSNNSLSASGTGTAATLKGKSGGSVDFGSRPVSLTYNGLNPALTVSLGTLVLNANPFTVNTASPLAAGTYTIATQTIGSITSSGTYPGVTGTAIGTGKVGAISVSGSNVLLTISVPTLTVTAFPSPQTAGVAGSVTVTAKDGAGNTATGYTGTVAFTSTDGAATLPANYTFVAGDNGVHTFTSGVTLRTVAGGTKSITATAVGTPATTGTQSGISVTPATATTLTVSGFPASKTAGAADNVTVTAKDAFNNVATGYTGTVAITSTDGAAVLPSNYTFVGGDNGTKLLSVTLNTVSGPTVAITATDTVTGTITGTQPGIIVLPDTSAATLQVTGFPSPQTAGVAGDVTVTAKKANGDTATGYTGTITFTNTGGAATLPANYTFLAGDNGVHTFTSGVTLTIVAGGTKSITATDTTSSITGTQSGITVTPATATTLMVTGYPNPQFAGTAGDVTVTAKDAYNNTATGYIGTVNFTSTDGGATLPSNYTFVGGDSGVHTFTGGVTFATAGTQSITATDTVTGTITGTQSGITVNLVPSIFSWINPAGGFWADAANWTNNAGISYVPDTAGASNYVLNFNQAGTYTTTHNLGNGFLLNRLNFGGAAVTLTGLNLALTNNSATLPQINQNSATGITVNNNLALGADTTVGGSGNGSVTLNGQLTGSGSLTKTTSGPLAIAYAGANTYSGGTIINAGTVYLPASRNNLLGSGPVTISNAALDFNAGSIANDLTLNTATLLSSNGFAGLLSGAVTLSGTTIFDVGSTGNSTISGIISGAGGFTKTGTSITPWTLTGSNTFTGNVTISGGTLAIGGSGYLGGGNYAGNITNNASFVYNSSADQTLSGVISGTGTITVSAGKLRLNGANTGSGAITVGSGGSLGGLGSVSSNVIYSGGAAALFTNSGTFAIAGSLTLNNNVVRLALPPGLGVGNYTLATYNPTGSAGAFASTPVIDSGSLLTGATATISTAGGTVTLTVAATPYYIWADSSFTNAFTDRSPASNPDGDSLTNLQEYAFGTDPTVSSAGPIAYSGGVLTACGPPEVSNFAGGPNGVDYRMVFCRRKNPASLGLTYTAEFSVDFANWSPNADIPTLLGTDAAGVMEVVSVPYPLFIVTVRGVEKPTFSRVKVESN